MTVVPEILFLKTPTTMDIVANNNTVVEGLCGFTRQDHTILIIVQRDATQSSLFIILQVHRTCFGCQPHPSSGVHKAVTTASGTGHIFCAASSLQRGQAWPRWREVAAQYRRL